MMGILPYHKPIPTNKNFICHVSQENAFHVWMQDTKLVNFAMSQALVRLFSTCWHGPGLGEKSSRGRVAAAAAWRDRTQTMTTSSGRARRRARRGFRADDEPDGALSSSLKTRHHAVTAAL